MDVAEIKKRARKISFVLHGVVVFVILVVGFFSDLSCVAKKNHEDSMQIEFTVDVSSFQLEKEVPVEEEKVEDLIPEAPETPVDDTEPAIEPEKPKPEKPKRKEIKVSKRIVVINQPSVKTPEKVKPTSTKKNDLTEEQVKKLLEMGAKPSDHTSVPGERERCLSIIYNKLYAAWRRPAISSSEVSRGAEITIYLGDNGYITKYVLSRSSGNKLLDASAESAAKAVRRIPGLPASFIKQNKSLTINFVIE